MTKDMTSGNPVKLIIIFSIPLLIGNVFQQFYSMVDTIIVGRYLGVDALAAVGNTGSMAFLINGFIVGLTSGFSIMVAQKFGAKDEEGLKKAVSSSIILSAAAVIIITIISILSSKFLLNLMNTPANIIDDSLKYINIIYSGTIAVLGYNMISSILRALGDSKTPLYFLIVSSVLNIILDLVFIVNFSMGVSGAAYATVISQGISAILCLVYTLKRYKILRLKKEDFKVEKSIFRNHLKIGIPMALQFSITAIGIMIVQGALNVFGSVVIASYTAASKVLQIVMQPAITLGVTMATFCGQNLGAKQVFNYSAYFFIPLGLIFVYRNALQGIGESFIPMMAGVYELGARALVAFTLPKFIGFTGICLSDPLAWIAAAVPLAYVYFRRINVLISEHNVQANN